MSACPVHNAPQTVWTEYEPGAPHAGVWRGPLCGAPGDPTAGPDSPEAAYVDCDCRCDCPLGRSHYGWTDLDGSPFTLCGLKGEQAREQAWEHCPTMIDCADCQRHPLIEVLAAVARLGAS